MEEIQPNSNDNVMQQSEKREKQRLKTLYKKCLGPTQYYIAMRLLSRARTTTLSLNSGEMKSYGNNATAAVKAVDYTLRAVLFSKVENEAWRCCFVLKEIL